MSSALNAALDGKAVPASQAPKALAEAAEKLQALKARMATVKENAATTAMAGVNALETAVTLGVAGAAEGYFGEEKMKWGPVPIRATTGLALTAWGLGTSLMGGNGSHQLAFGTALIGADAYMMGRQGGVALREKKNGAAPPANAVAATPAQAAIIQANPGAKLLNGKVVGANGAALEGDDLGDLSRMIRLQPGTAGEDGGRRAQRALPEGAPRRRQNID